MRNIEFLTEILTTRHDYWIASRKEYNKSCSVWMIVIPNNIRRELKKEEILLTDLEALQKLYVMNICISEPYAPFQYGISMYNFYRGYPVIKDVKDTLKKALELGSKDIFQYKEMCLESEIISQ